MTQRRLLQLSKPSATSQSALQSIGLPIDPLNPHLWIVQTSPSSHLASPALLGLIAGKLTADTAELRLGPAQLLDPNLQPDLIAPAITLASSLGATLLTLHLHYPANLQPAWLIPLAPEHLRQQLRFGLLDDPWLASALQHGGLLQKLARLEDQSLALSFTFHLSP